jgi:hypothetical protein
MNIKQWQKHEEHMNDHISWPAGKQQVIDACNGEDVEPEVMAEIKAIPDREYESPEDLKSILLKEED